MIGGGPKASSLQSASDRDSSGSDESSSDAGSEIKLEIKKPMEAGS